MKKLVFALSMVPALAFAELKLATVDLLVLVRNHPDYDRNEKFMESKSKDLEKKVQAIKSEGEELQAEGKKLMEQFRNPMLNEKAKAETERKLQDLQQKLIQIEQRYRSEAMRGNQDLQEDRNRLMKATTDDLRVRLRKFAEAKDYDLILTGDLGELGHDIVRDFFRRDGIDLTDRYQDCGLLLYDREKQDMHAGASGCGCSAAVLNGYVLPGLRAGKWRRVLFAPTGALLSPTTSFQGESVPGICHAVCLSVEA